MGKGSELDTESRMSTLETKVEALARQFGQIDAKLDKILASKGTKGLVGVIIGLVALQMTTIGVVVAIVWPIVVS